MTCECTVAETHQNYLPNTNILKIVLILNISVFFLIHFYFYNFKLLIKKALFTRKYITSYIFHLSIYYQLNKVEILFIFI